MLLLLPINAIPFRSFLLRPSNLSLQFLPVEKLHTPLTLSFDGESSKLVHAFVTALEWTTATWYSLMQLDLLLTDRSEC